MSLPKNIKAQFLTRFDELIAEGKSICNAIQVIPPHTSGNVCVTFTTYNWDAQRLEKWKTNCLTLFHPFLVKGTNLDKQVDSFSHTSGKKPDVQRALGILEAFRDDLEKGFLDDFLLRVEAEVAADYMGQADALLKEGQPGVFDHVPAAVLTGAVFEKALRTLCDRQQSQIPLVNAKGENKTLNPLIDDLKKAGVFNELKAKQLRAWADIRNKAAHGEFDQFTKGDVEQMLGGITNFLADYLQ
jgi:hypothetical protein